MSGLLKETERSMLDRLNVRYGKFNNNGFRYTRAEHVKVTAGHDASRICDYMSIDLWTGYGLNAGPKLHGHEVKTSRSDWLLEMRDPSKAEAFSRYCDYWWLVISDKSLVLPGELPVGWGLMVPHGSSLRVVKAAELQVAVEPMPRHLQATLTRAVMKTTARLTLTADGAVRQIFDRMPNRPIDCAS